MIPLDRAIVDGATSSRDMIGRHVEILSETDSTNDRCHERAWDKKEEGLVIVAEYQSSGRGQRGSTWSAPRYSSLLFSILLFPEEELASARFLTAWAASGVASVLRERGIDSRIKWPNDILIDGRKICGILVEQRIGTVVGIGLNVSIPTGRISKQPSTSCHITSNRDR